MAARQGKSSVGGPVVPLPVPGTNSVTPTAPMTPAIQAIHAAPPRPLDEEALAIYSRRKAPRGRSGGDVQARGRP
jgi:hypothetical protein